MAQVMEHSEELESSRSASLLSVVRELNESQESKSHPVSNLESELFEKMSQVRQMENNVYSMTEAHIRRMSENHHAELRERDARLMHQDAELAHAQQVVAEAHRYVSSNTVTPAELYEQRQRMQSEYEQSLREVARVQEERARLLAAQKNEQDKTTHMSLSLSRLKEEVDAYEKRYLAFIQGRPQDSQAELHYQAILDQAARKYRDELDQMTARHRKASESMKQQVSLLTLERDTLRKEQIDLAKKYQRAKTLARANSEPRMATPMKPLLTPSPPANTPQKSNLAATQTVTQTSVGTSTTQQGGQNTGPSGRDGNGQPPSGGGLPSGNSGGSG